MYDRRTRINNITITNTNRESSVNEAFQQRLRLWHAILLVSNDHCKLPLLLEIAVEREISSMNFFKNIELRAQQVRTPQLSSNLKTR